MKTEFSHFLYAKNRCVITSPITNKIPGIITISIRPVIIKLLKISGIMPKYNQITNHAIWRNPMVFNDSLRSFLKINLEIKMPTPKFKTLPITLVIMLNDRELSTKFAKTRESKPISRNNQTALITSVMKTEFSHFLYAKNRCVITRPTTNKILGMTTISIRPVIIKLLKIAGIMVKYTQIANHAIWTKLIVFNDSMRSFLKINLEIKILTPKFNAQVIALVIMLNNRDFSTKFAKTRESKPISRNNQTALITSVIITEFSHFLYAKYRCVITTPKTNKILGMTTISIRPVIIK